MIKIKRWNEYKKIPGDGQSGGRAVPPNTTVFSYQYHLIGAP
jgi:hypothetical protein